VGANVAMAEAEDRARLSQALNELDMRIHANLSRDEVMQVTLDGFVAALAADVGDIKLLDGDEWTVRFVCGFDPDVIGLRLSIPDAPVATRVATLRAPITIQDFLAEPESFYVGFPRIHGLRSCLAAPLFIDREVVGCLFAWMRDSPRTFTAAEMDFSRRVAASVALALDNARLFEAEHAARMRAEVAEQRLAEELERTRVLVRASDELMTASDPRELLERLGRVVLDATGMSRVFINLIDMREQVLTPMVATGGLAAPLGDRIPLANLSETARRAIAGGMPLILDYERPELPPQDKAIAESNHARLVLFVPLVYRGEVIGHISLDEPGARYDFTVEQMQVVRSIAAQAAVVLQNARVLEREHGIAEAFQRAILTPPEHISSLEISYLYQPASASANVGGDFYDVYGLDGGVVAIVIGDVAGKGVQAARLTVMIREGIRAYASEDPDPASVLGRLNSLMYRFTQSDMFATGVFCVLDSATGALRFCNAAHPAPVVLAEDGVRTLEAQSGLLGAFPDARFIAAEDILQPGEVLCLFTDGATEAQGESGLLGEDGVRGALDRLRGTPVEDLPQALLERVMAYSCGNLRDDIAIVCVARKATDSS